MSNNVSKGFRLIPISFRVLLLALAIMIALALFFPRYYVKQHKEARPHVDAVAVEMIGNHPLSEWKPGCLLVVWSPDKSTHVSKLISVSPDKETVILWDSTGHVIGGKIADLKPKKIRLFCSIDPGWSAWKTTYIEQLFKSTPGQQSEAQYYF